MPRCTEHPSTSHLAPCHLGTLAPLHRSHNTPVSRLVLIVCAAEVLGMAPFSMFLALQPHLREEWQLSNTETGWISSAYYAGYMLAVPLLVSLTDRHDARRVWLLSTALAAASAVGFSLVAGGPGTAALMQLLAGASLAGTYMPGLKLIADRVDGVPHPRHVAFYTTSFTIGSSLSFYAVGQLFDWVTWRSAVLAAAAGPAIAWLLIRGLLRPVPMRRHSADRSHWQTVLRSPDTMRYVLGYACHMWELFAVRAWLVPFLAFCESLAGRPPFGTAATLAALISLVGVPASFAGAELTTRVDRRRLLTIVMSASAFVSLAIGSTALASWSVILVVGIAYSATVSADSAALTSGIVAVSDPQSRGTAMALYSTAGFAAASAGSFAIGGLLDLLGGQSVFSWTIAFAAMGASNLVGVVLLRAANK